MGSNHAAIHQDNGKSDWFLVLVEDLTPQKRQLVLKHKLNEELKREIAQRERAESRQAESEKKYREVVETAGDIIYQTDRRGCFTLVNPVGLKISGYAAEELIGNSYLDLIPPDHRKSVERFYRIQFVKKTAHHLLRISTGYATRRNGLVGSECSTFDGR